MANEVTVKEKKPVVKKHRLKEVGSELKKISFPTLKKTIQQTGIVISVVVVVTLVLFAIDWLLSLLYNLLVSGI